MTRERRAVAMSDEVSGDSARPNGSDSWRSYLRAETQSSKRQRGQIPKDSIARSYFLMRTLVGILGLSLPVFLLLGDLLFLRHDFSVRGSLSAYYHSGMRDVFVGILSIVGILLITYKVTERNRGNALSTVAGFSAIMVALFPTGLPAYLGPDSRTPLQARLGEELVSTIHYAFAATFIIALAILCYDFAWRERIRTRWRDGRPARFSPESWYRFHISMTGIIVIAIVFMALTHAAGRLDKHSLLIGESIAGLAFGLSWLAKGLEWDVLPERLKW
jgi:hypothetical protein